jgi:AcrR family transcriptional regulator
MSAPLRMPSVRRERRSHAERAAATQARIKAAVVEAIEQSGLQSVTAAEISRRSGVSWGAAQHHFGDKDGILTAVLVDSFNRLAGGLDAIRVEGRTLEERVALFVDAAWSHFDSGHYRSMFEILMNVSVASTSEVDLVLRERTLEAWQSLWRRFFGDARLPREREVALQLYTVSTLSGLATLAKLEGATRRPRTELDFLKDTLLRELGAEDVR